MVTGASGFLGRRLVSALLGRARVVAVDMLPRVHAYVPEHREPRSGTRWTSPTPRAWRSMFRQVREGGPLDAIVHLAAYYDFTGEPSPEYQRANVDALGILLDACRPLNLRRFVYASSIGACRPTRTRVPINEETPPDGDHVYAVTKRRGEELVRGVRGRDPLGHRPARGALLRLVRVPSRPLLSGDVALRALERAGPRGAAARRPPRTCTCATASRSSSGCSSAWTSSPPPRC